MGGSVSVGDGGQGHWLPTAEDRARIAVQVFLKFRREGSVDPAQSVWRMVKAVAEWGRYGDGSVDWSVVCPRIEDVLERGINPFQKQGDS